MIIVRTIDKSLFSYRATCSSI